MNETKETLRRTRGFSVAMVAAHGITHSDGRKLEMTAQEARGIMAKRIAVIHARNGER